MYKNGLQATIERMVGGSNGGPTDGQDGQNSDGGAQVGQIISSKTEEQAPASPALLPVNQVTPAPAENASETPAVDATVQTPPPATGQA
jgi:hypothetical protein